MKHYAERTQIEEIQEFADVFGIAKKTGGNLTEIIGETANAIGEKIEVNKEIQVVLAEKQLEQKGKACLKSSTQHFNYVQT